MYLPAIVMVGFYFEKRRALATGIAVCGSGIGAFVFAPMCEKLLEYYDWKGATWIISAIVLNGCVLGALYQPLEPEKPKKKQAPPVTNGTGNACSPRRRTVSENPKDMQPKDILKARVSESYEVSLYAGNGARPEDTLLQKGSMRELNCEEKEKLCAFSKSCDEAMFKQLHDEKQKEDDLKRPMYRKDIFYSGSIENLEQFKESADVASYVQSVTSIPKTEEGAKGCFAILQRRCKSCTDTLRQMLDFSLLLDPVFCVYGMSCFLCMAGEYFLLASYIISSISSTGFYVPFTYLPHHATEMGLSLEQAAFLLSIIGIANTIARVLCGWVSDQSWADCLIINNVALMMGGIATVLCPFCYNYAMLATYSAVFGSGIGSCSNFL
jgi:hypothetical protein